MIDFDEVYGIDSSAGYAFQRLSHVAERKGFVLLITGLDTHFSKRGSLRRFLLQGDAVRSFADVDHGLEWYETQLLASDVDTRARNSRTILQYLAELLSENATLSDFLVYLSEVSFPQGFELIKQGTVSDDLYLLERGEVSVYLPSFKGNRVRIRRTGSGSVLGELGFYIGTPRTASVLTERPGKAYRLTTAALARMEVEKPEFAAALHPFWPNACCIRRGRCTRLWIHPPRSIPYPPREGLSPNRQMCIAGQVFLTRSAGWVFLESPKRNDGTTASHESGLVYFRYRSIDVARASLAVARSSLTITHTRHSTEATFLSELTATKVGTPWQ